MSEVDRRHATALRGEQTEQARANAWFRQLSRWEARDSG